MWIFLPKKVQIERSVDGQKFEIVHVNPIQIIVSATHQDIFEYSAELHTIKDHGTFVLQD